jgi:hypothetical protein
MPQKQPTAILGIPWEKRDFVSFIDALDGLSLFSSVKFVFAQHRCILRKNEID